jgi:acyl-CoA synthetase (AMP-forming)/AMP-acid ligase II
VTTIPEVVRGAAERFVEHEALVDGDRRWTFARLHADIRNAARAFLHAGLASGDRVAIWAPNSAEWMIGCLGAQYAGGVVVPLNTRFKGPEAAYVLEKSGARFLLTVNGFLGLDFVDEIRRAMSPTPATILLEGDSEGAITWSDFIDAGAHVPDTEVDERASAIADHDLCDIIFTSGTTGHPKGVMSRHDQTCEVFRVWSDVVGLGSNDRYLIVNPFFHTFGYKAGFLACLLRGAAMLPLAVFDVPNVLRMVSTERITALPGPPTLYLSILNHPDRHAFDLSSLRLAVTGAAAVPVEMIRRMREELSFRVILTAYGLTESTGTITMCRQDDDPETISSTSGRAIDDIEVRVVDENNVEVPRGTAGEIVCRGYNVMPGYFADPVATADTIDDDGWLHTGDIGVMDTRGYVTITDRLKDMFIVGGFNAYPAEIENALLGHPAVAQVAVVGRPDERMGEVGHAFVVRRTGESVGSDELIEWARTRMANYKVPRGITFVESLPLNASGKVLKFELRERLR